MTRCFSNIILEPIITEKSTSLAQFSKYTFKVARDASKDQIKTAFKKVYPDLKVVSVNTQKVLGQAKRTKAGYRNPVDGKKAIITVEGGTIDYFPETA